MIKLCTVDEVRAAEQAAVRAGRLESDLMLQAGRAVADVIASAAGERQGSALFLVGPGNNGGDGLVAAGRLLERGWRCRVWGFNRDDVRGAPVSQDVAARLEWLPDIESLSRACAEADVVVDAVFGIGGRAGVPDPVVHAFQLAWEARVDRGTVLFALDTPSGVDADSGAAHDRAFRADHTIMIGLPKVGLYRPPALRYTGRLHLVPIGLPAPTPSGEEPWLITAEDVRRWLPRRPADAHKHGVGSLLIVGGAPNYYGAPRLSAEAGYRAGAGLVTLAVPRSLIPPIASTLPEVTYIPLAEEAAGGGEARTAAPVRERLGSYRALLIGPGLGQDARVDAFLSDLFQFPGDRPRRSGSEGQAEDEAAGFRSRAVIDADGLNWLARHPNWPEHLRQAELVLTPHPGELARLLGSAVADIVSDPWRAARTASRRFRQVTVLKYGHTVVASPDGTLLIGPQVLPSLATAGSGDVLAGVIAGLMAQGMGAREAAAAGVFIGTEAALDAEQRVGTLSLMASDLIDALPAALRGLYDTKW